MARTPARQPSLADPKGDVGGFCIGDTFIRQNTEVVFKTRLGGIIQAKVWLVTSSGNMRSGDCGAVCTAGHQAPSSGSDRKGQGAGAGPSEGTKRVRRWRRDPAESPHVQPPRCPTNRQMPGAEAT